MPESNGDSRLGQRIVLWSLACGLVFALLGSVGIESSVHTGPNGSIQTVEPSFDPLIGFLGFLIGVVVGGGIVSLAKLPRVGKTVAVAFLALVGCLFGAFIGARFGMQTKIAVTEHSFSGESKASPPAIVAGALIGMTVTTILAWGTLYSAQRRFEGPAVS
jgi:hypothetical protein